MKSRTHKVDEKGAKKALRPGSERDLEIADQPATVARQSEMLSAEVGETAERDEIARTAVARRLGISIRTLRRLEDRGELVPRIDVEGMRHFTTAEVEAFARSRGVKQRAETTPGEIAARAFELFEQG